MRRTALLLIAAVSIGCIHTHPITTTPVLPQPIQVVDPEVLLKFNDAYAPYFRKFFNCPEHATEASECRPNAAPQNDQKLFDRCRKAAKKLFGFRD